MTVAMPVGSFFPTLGGAQVGLHNIAIRLRERGVRPVIIAPWRSWRACREGGWNFPYEIAPLPPKFGSLLAAMPGLMLPLVDRYLSCLDRKYRFDFWHCTYGYPVGVSVLHYLGANSPGRHLIRCVGDDIQVAPEIGYGMRLDPRIDSLVRQWLPKSDAMVAITDSVAEEYRSLGVPEAHIKFIPNGVDLARFEFAIDHAEVRRRYGIPTEAFMFFSVGRQHPKKDFANLINAFALFERQHPGRAVLAIAGPGVSELTGNVERHGLADCVRLIEGIGAPQTDTVPEVPSPDLVALYKCADAFAFPSLIETFGIAIVEAMAAGLPIITTDGPGCRDVVRKGQDGMMVRAGDPEALAAAMIEIANNEELRRHYAERAKRRAAAFSWDIIVDRYMELYQEKPSSDLPANEEPLAAI
jgi:glycosyltransferase involved in cell wall biosynthesis